MSDAATITILPVTPELPRTAHARLEAFAAAFALPPKVLFAADTALEELLQNVLDYSGAHEVRLHLAVESGELRVELADDGRPYNPLLAKGPDLSLPLDERDVGGLGIHLVRKMMDRTAYEHRGGCNRVSLVKILH